VAAISMSQPLFKSDFSNFINMEKRFLGYTFSLLHVDHVALNHDWNFTNVISPYHRIYYISGGEGFIATGNKQTKLEAGYLYIIPNYTLCNLACYHFLSQYFLHFFEESATNLSLFEQHRNVIKIRANEIDILNFKRLLLINPGRGINRSDNPAVYEKNNLYKHYQEFNNDGSNAVYFETQGILLQMISRFLDTPLFKPNDSDPIPSKILIAVRYIQVNLKHNITVNQLASNVNLQKDYFSRLFYKYTGLRPLSYIQEKRIEHAQYLIATTGLAFNEISEKSGFKSVSYFTKIFKKVTSFSPDQYRRKQKVIY